MFEVIVIETYCTSSHCYKFGEFLNCEKFKSKYKYNRYFYKFYKEGCHIFNFFPYEEFSKYFLTIQEYRSKLILDILS